MAKTDREHYDELRDRVITGVDWRWTGSRVSVLGLHPSVLLLFPGLFITQLSYKFMALAAVYVAFLMFLSFREMSPFEFFTFIRNRFFQQRRWPTK